MDYTKWDTVENWKLTNRGEKEVEAFIRECKAKRKEIMDAGIDTACHTRIPTKALILADINCEKILQKMDIEVYGASQIIMTCQFF